MQLPTTIAALLISMTCCSQNNYKDLLSIRLKEIEELQLYDNSFVVYNEVQGYTYAFAALAHKDFDGLFNVILNNLSDTTRITQMTSDYGFDVYPADLMISYKSDDLTKEERAQLQKLIETKYNHLTYARELLTGK